MAMTYRWVGIAGACAVLIGACHGGDGSGSPGAGASAAGASGSGTSGSGGASAGASGSSPPLVTGLDRNRLLSSLSTQEVRQLCEAVEDWYLSNLDIERYQRGRCTFEAIDDSGSVDGGVIYVDVAACDASASRCLADGGVPLPSYDCAREQLDSTAFDGCDISLGSYQDCTTALVQRGAGVFDPYTCEAAAELLNEDLQASLNNPDAPQPIEQVSECAPFLAACPSVAQP